MNQKLEVLNELLTTLLRVSNEGLAIRFNMHSWSTYTNCGTAHCLAGWFMFFNHGDQQPFLYAQKAAKTIHPRFRDKTWRILFGSKRGEGPQSLARQIRAVRWFMDREEKLIEYQRLREMPRKERRRLGIAA